MICLSSPYAQTKEEDKKLNNEKSINDSTEWDIGSVINLGFNGVGLYNWAAGGQNSISINGLLSLKANYSKNKIIWDNNIDMAYGIWGLNYVFAAKNNLVMNTFIDERKNDTLATEAALKQLKHLHNKYKDLSLTILAYVSSPSLVNKIIKRDI